LANDHLLWLKRVLKNRSCSWRESLGGLSRITKPSIYGAAEATPFQNNGFSAPVKAILSEAERLDLAAEQLGAGAKGSSTLPEQSSFQSNRKWLSCVDLAVICGTYFKPA
jgi:hypothetical protein